MLKDSYGNTRFFGIYRGVVVETADPLNRGRIRVKVPQILADYATDWAWPSVSAGVSTPITPSIDDGVWVMFEGGDPSFPVWMGVFNVSLPVTTQGISAGPTGPVGPTGVAVANSPLYLSGPTGASLYIQDATTSVKGAVQLTDSTSSTSTTTAATPNSVKLAYDKITTLDSLSDVATAGAATGQVLTLQSSGTWQPQAVSVGSPGAMNYAQNTATSITVSSGTPTLVSQSITTTGFPVLITVSGSASPGSVAANGTRSMSVNVLRGTDVVPTGVVFPMDGLDSDAALPFSFTVIDTPTANTYTYNVQPGQTSASTWTWQRVHITVVELTGAIGPTGPAPSPNYLINGGFDFWQRGTSISVTANASYTADRWIVQFNGSGATRTISQQTFTPGAAPVSGYEGSSFLRFAHSVAGSGASFNSIGQRIEDVRTLAGKTVTVSFWAKAASTITIPNMSLWQNFGTGGSSTVGTDFASSLSIGTSWTRYSYTVTLPSISGKTIGTNSYLHLEMYQPVNQTFTFDLWGVQVEEGSVATPFRRAGSTYTEEQLACFRYYQLHDVIFGTSDGTYKFGTNPAGYLLRTTPTSVVVGTISAPFSGTVLGTNVTMTRTNKAGFYSTSGSLGSGGWVNFTNVAVTAEL